MLEVSGPTPEQPLLPASAEQLDEAGWLLSPEQSAGLLQAHQRADEYARRRVRPHPQCSDSAVQTL